MTLRRLGLAVVITALVGGVLAPYYLVHKPLTPGQALALLQSGLNLAVALALVLAAGGLGRRLLRAALGAGPATTAPGSGPLIAVALGLGALSLTMLLLGALRLFYPAVAWLLVGGLGLWLRRDIAAWVAALAATVRLLVPSSRLERLAAGFVLVVFSVGFLRALAPPLMWDALVYHLTLPDLYARAHSVWVNPAQVSLVSGMPQLNEMLYTAANLLRAERAAGAITAQFLGWCFGVCLGLGLVTHARSLGLPGWLAAAILFSAWSVALELAWAYTELLLMLMSLAVVVALGHWRRHLAEAPSATRWLGLAGVFAGLACGCKYTGVIVPLAGVAVIGVIELTRPGLAGRARLLNAARSILLFGLLAALTFTPWMLKNGLLTGSPFYPLLWPAADADALRQWFYTRPDQAEPLGRALLIFVRASLFGVQSGNETDATLGPLLLLGAALLVFSWRGLAPAVRHELALVVGIAAVAYLGWVGLAAYSGMGRQARLFFSFLPAVALLGAAGLAGLRAFNTPSLRLTRIVTAAFVLVLGLSAFELGARFVAHNPLPYLVGLQTAADYETAALGWYGPALARVNQLPAGARVVFLWEPRTLGCAETVHCLPDVVVDRWWYARQQGADAQQAIAQWRAAGATHVLLYEVGARFIENEPGHPFEPADWAELDRLRAALRLVESLGDGYTLYALP